MYKSYPFIISDSSHVGEVRRFANYIAEKLEFDVIQKANIAIIVTEVATNIVKHAKKGEIILTEYILAPHAKMEVLALDKGIGMSNAKMSLQDGHSTSATLGVGLGAIKRLAARFDVYSTVGGGTVIWAEIFAKPPQTTLPLSLLPCVSGAISVAMKGESCCGDGWSVHGVPDSAIVRCTVADGLGHGSGAAEASSKALQLIQETLNLNLTETFQLLQKGIRKTYGAAIIIVDVDFSQRLLKYVSVGNIGGQIILSEKSKHLIATPGIVGHTVYKIHELNHSFSEDFSLVIYSDGLISHWDLEKYPGLRNKHPNVIAGVLYRDYKRGYDDTTVLVLKHKLSEN